VGPPGPGWDGEFVNRRRRPRRDTRDSTIPMALYLGDHSPKNPIDCVGKGVNFYHVGGRATGRARSHAECVRFEMGVGTTG
jgi:hypothetical protein